MTSNGRPSPKSLKWLVPLAIADVLAVLLLMAPEILSDGTLTEVGTNRLLTTTVMPVVVLLVVNVLPHNIKAVLVYWKLRDVLPGCAAFTRYGPGDARIDMVALQKNVGNLPTEPSEQNAKWYKLYKLVKYEPTVLDAHKHFLMYRDMAVLSLLLVVFVPLSLHLVGAPKASPWLAAGLFIVQYLLTALSARWCSIRFVCNVLAVHSTQKVRQPMA